MLFYCSSFNSFSLTLCTFKHRKGICTYLSSYLPRLHNKLDYVRLSRNLYIDYVHLSRNLHIHYVRLGRNLYIHYVRLRPTFFKSQFFWLSGNFCIGVLQRGKEPITSLISILAQTHPKVVNHFGGMLA